MKSSALARTALGTSALLIAGFVTLPAPSATAVPGDERGDWFVEDAQLRRDVGAPKPPGTTQSRAVTLDADAAVRAVVATSSLARAEPGERLIVPKRGDLSLTLFDGERLTVEVSEVAVTLDVASTESVPTVEVIGTEKRAGTIASTVAFTFIPDASGDYVLHGGIERDSQPRVELDQPSRGVVRLNEIGDPPARPIDTDDAILAPESGDAAMATPKEGGSRATPAITIIDLLVGYSSSLDASMNSRAEITQRIAETNTALATSGANVRVNLMSIAPVPYVQHPSDMHVDLDRLQKKSGSLDLLHAQRDAIGADLVALVVPNTTASACGIAWVPRAGGAADYGLSVTAQECFHQHSLAHELGHNLGSQHDHNNATTKGDPYLFSHGYQVPGVARDIMSYACPKNDCKRFLQYSNPSVNFLGTTVPSGTATADAARSFNLMAPVIANYRTKTKVTRLSGADRYDTAAAISRHGFTDPAKVSTLVVATGTDFPDALSAAPLAAKLGGPLLLTHPSGLPAATVTEIKRLKPSKVVVIGGATAVPAAVESALKGLVAAGGSVQRISGDDRYSTSVAIGKYGWGSSATAFVATGLDYPDALSAGAAAGKLGAPVVLVPGTFAAAPAVTTSYLTGIGVKTAYIAGGMTVVSAGIENALKAKHTVVRYAGTDRFNTSTLIAKAHNTPGGSMYLASGLNFPDALAGAVIAGRQKAPLALSPQNCVLRTLNDVQRDIKPSEVVLLGGATLLSEAVQQGNIC
ncbi:hypothetical protein GCM10027406_37250 [Leifsonia lichenia]